MQGAAVGGVEDSPGLDVGDGLLDHLADPVDAPVLLLRGFAQFAVGGFLHGVIIPLPTYRLVGDLPGGVDSLEQSGGVWGGHVVHGPRIGVGGPHQTPVKQDQDLDVHPRAPALTATTDRGACASPSRGRGRRPPRSRTPRAPPWP